MRLIKWHAETSMQGCDNDGEIEVEDNATDEEIEEAVREEVFNWISWGWVEAETAGTGRTQQAGGGE